MTEEKKKQGDVYDASQKQPATRENGLYYSGDQGHEGEAASGDQGGYGGSRAFDENPESQEAPDNTDPKKQPAA